MHTPHIICFGELLWDILPTGALPGGAPMNVAYHLHRLGLPASLVTRVGTDERGRELLNVVKEKGISAEGIQTDADTPTGIVLAQPGEAHEMHYDIVAPAAWDNIAYSEALAAAAARAAYFVFGSLAAREAVSAGTLLRLLDTPATKVLDINLRPPHFTPATLETLLHKADILKMNLSELELISNWYGQPATLAEKTDLLRNRFHIPTIIVTMGADGAAIDVEGQLHRHPGYKVEVADTVGSGDAFLAAFLSGIIRQAPVADTLDFAAALGALVASRTGGWPAYALEDIDAIRGGG
ncbi:carbohydrate kinase [Chitinophaga alhagiae]|uniref:Carbohydrate kinase n=1 Tax=Chitinophaga alhagiae TaxID=2203219 RepID=A0ABM6W9Y2_9BACT|nr:carbohydrate kinase [Chitinophaga alhagiae]AWO00637.1 carbohydrate kinase [Chitinophaga alhagiae]